MNTVVESLFTHAEHQPHKTALVVGDTAYSYRQLADSTLVVAQFFRQLGVKRGDFIVLSADASPSFIYGYFAAHLLSAISVPIDPASSIERLFYIVDKVRPKAIFSKNAGAVEGAVYHGTLEDIKRTADEKRELGLPFVPLYPAGELVADVLFTSGTTGDAKGVMLKHSAIRAAALHINAFIGNTTDDVEVIPLPLSHSFGLGRLRCNILTGGTIILVPGLTNLALILKALRDHSATGLASVPAGFALFLKMGPERLAEFSSQLQYIEIGSSPMPLDHKQQLMKLLPQTRICMHYGLTEASRSAFIEFHSDKNNLTSVGKPSPGVQLRIADDNGVDCPVGSSGRILIAGPHCMAGYWNDPERTTKAFVDGWLDTGDFGHIDAQGVLYLEARQGEMINIGGMKVAPVEVESVLSKHPAIQECACVAVADPRGITGQAVKAFIVLIDGASEPIALHEIIGFMHGKIESYKMPVDVEVVDQIPKTESGKIKRSDLQT